MLINTPPKQNATVAIKLAGGDEIIAKLISSNDRTIVITRPLAITLVPSQNGQAQVAMVPWLFAIPDSNEISVNLQNVIAWGEARAEATASYIKHTTGLDVPSGLVL